MNFFIITISDTLQYGVFVARRDCSFEARLVRAGFAVCTSFGAGVSWFLGQGSYRRS